MKPTIKSSIPLELFRFSAALFFFICVCAILSFRSLHQASPRYAKQYRFNDAKISPDGRLIYRAASEGADGGTMDWWEFDETLRSPHPENPELSQAINRMLVEVLVKPVSVKNIRRNSRVVWPLRYTSDQIYLTPRIWWNGPAGQVDMYPGMRKERFDVLSEIGWQSQDPHPYIITPQGIYELLLTGTDISAKLVYKGSCEAFGWVAQTFPQTQSDDAKLKLLVVHGNTLSILDPAGALLRDIKLPESVPASLKENNAWFTLFNNGKVSVNLYRDHGNKRSILLLAEDGSLVRQVDYNTDEITKAMNGGAGRNPSILFPTLIPPMLVPWLMEKLVPLAQMHPMPPKPWLMEKWALIQSLVLSLALASAILWHQTRLGYRGARRAVWVVFTFVFGLLGFITYVTAYRDRRSEPCPDCRRRCPVTEEICPHCGAPWPAPKPLGIEIIEPA
jgi:hypothetical protein